MPFCGPSIFAVCMQYSWTHMLYRVQSDCVRLKLAHTLQMKGRWESNLNVWFPLMYSQKWNCYFQNRIIMFCLPVPTLIYLWEIYIFPGSVCLFCCREICGPRSWEYINSSQTHECGNWDWGRAIPRKGIYKWDFPCSADPGTNTHEWYKKQRWNRE
jgi:hypothetical protein